MSVFILVPMRFISEVFCLETDQISDWMYGFCWA